MFWPTPQDYNEAIQFIDTNLSDEELRAGSVELTQLGLPRPITGAFASVYKIHAAQKNWAAKCFLNDLPDLKERYKAIAEFVHNDDLPYTLDFVYLKEGIRIRGDWYPILKMEWVEGEQLFEYVRNNLTRSYKLTKLADRFLEMLKRLHDAGIAHGDLQHGNIIVLKDELYLVDYDGMYVPQLKGWTSNELGHRNYQHPARTKTDFGTALDNFSAWVIYASLRCLSLDVSLWNVVQPDGECLLFRQSDFQSPENSEIFPVLESHECDIIRNLAARIHRNCQAAIEEVPVLRWADNETVELPPSAKTKQGTKSGGKKSSETNLRSDRGKSSDRLPELAQTEAVPGARAASAPTLVLADNTLRLVEDPTNATFAPSVVQVTNNGAGPQSPAGSSSGRSSGTPQIAPSASASVGQPSPSSVPPPPGASKQSFPTTEVVSSLVLSVAAFACVYLSAVTSGQPPTQTPSTPTSYAQSNPKLHLINKSAEDGEDLLKAHKYKEAAQAYQTAYQAANEFYGAESTTTADIGLGYAKALNAAGDYGAAQPIIYSTISRYRAAYDLDKMNDAQNELAINEYYGGHYHEALLEFQSVGEYWRNHLYGSQTEEKLEAAQEWEQKTQTALAKNNGVEGAAESKTAH
jgi:serine/threonine protein kinase